MPRGRLTPKADLDILPDIAGASAAKLSPVACLAMRGANIRVAVACPKITVLVDDGPIILGHLASPAMRVGIVDAGKDLMRPPGC